MKQYLFVTRSNNQDDEGSAVARPITLTIHNNPTESVGFWRGLEFWV